MLNPKFKNKAKGVAGSKPARVRNVLVALVDLKLTCCGSIKKGEIFKMPCHDCAEDLIKAGKAKRIEQ